MKLIRSAPKNAAHNPLTVKASVSQDVNKRSSALSMSVKIPKVTTIKGAEKNSRIGLISALIKPNIKATSKACQRFPVSSIPLINCAANQMAKAFASRRINSLIQVLISHHFHLSVLLVKTLRSAYLISNRRRLRRSGQFRLLVS